MLGRGLVPSDEPILTADDLGLLRGDGIFETMHVRDGAVWQLDEHLDRMTRSAHSLGLDLPTAGDLTELITQATAAWPTGREGALRLVCTRGREHRPGAPATVIVSIQGVNPTVIESRHAGIAVVTASLGLPAAARESAPWLLGGAKTLSYAVNMATLRWAQRQGADDALWISADGYALEAPTSTLVWFDGATLCTVPVAKTGILAGTTARWLLDHADQLGLGTAERMITPAELAAADGAWLTSSVRGIAAIRSLDGAGLAAPVETTTRLRELLGFG